MSKEIPSREELLLRVEASKERKRKRLAEMEVRARELFKERTGNEPKYVYSLNPLDIDESTNHRAALIAVGSLLYVRPPSTVPPLFLHSFTIKPLDLHWSHTGLTLEQHCSYSYPTFVLRQMPMRYSVTALQWNPQPIKYECIF